MKLLLIVIVVGYAIGNHLAIFTHRKPKPQQVVIPAFTTQVFTPKIDRVWTIEHSSITCYKKKKYKKKC